MYSHLEKLIEYFPDLLSRSILDVGSGRGKFLIEAKKAGSNAVGLEMNPAYIQQTEETALSSGVEVKVVSGVAEKLPFEDNSFDFVNMSEVIEHVEDPEIALQEVYRVLRPLGQAYLSVPARFGVRDPHYKMYFVNLMPRPMANFYIRVLGKQRDCGYGAGLQNLDEMHYFTYGKILAVLRRTGFKVRDMRLEKINKDFKNFFIRMIVKFFYGMIKEFYPVAFHFVIIKIKI